MEASKIKVIKFGGSSLADAVQFGKVKKIVQSDPSRRYVIPSAPGRRFKDDAKVTDMLYQCYDMAVKGENIDALFASITARYDEIIHDLGLALSLDEQYAAIKNAFLCHVGRDYAASRGEYLNGIVLAKYLGYHFIDAARVIYFNNDGTFDGETTNKLMAELLHRHTHAVIPGFYGSMPNDTIKTFSRGGSDVTGSIVARAANADLYENWTDVSGCLMADPRIVDNPKPISVITYDELRELSYMGATVLHEDAIFPVRHAGIAINIRNTNEPEAPGTMIVSASGEGTAYLTDEIITGVAGKCGFSVLSIQKDMMNNEVGFGRKVLEVIEEQGICFEHLPSGIDTMSVVLNNHEIEGKTDAIINEICHEVHPDSVSLDGGLALIAVVGRGMVRAKGTAYRVFKAISQAQINVRMIDQGSSEQNIIIGVDERDYEKALRSIYMEFESDNKIK